MIYVRAIVFVFAMILLVLLGIPFVHAGMVLFRSGYVGFHLRSDSIELTNCHIPHLLTIPTFAAWSLYFVLRRKTKSLRAGHCRKCRYNLRGNLSDRCPECGAAVSDFDFSLYRERQEADYSQSERLFATFLILIAIVTYTVFYILDHGSCG